MRGAHICALPAKGSGPHNRRRRLLGLQPRRLNAAHFSGELPIERHDSKRHHELSDEQEALNNMRLRLENPRAFVALARELGYSELEIRRLVAYVDDRQEPLVRLIEAYKSRGVSDLNTVRDG
jgi:hypothetical protein